MRSQRGFASGRSTKRAGTLFAAIASFHACGLTLLRFGSSPRPKHNPPGFGPRFGLGARFGPGPRFGFGARIGFGARFGLGARFGPGPRFGLGPRLGFGARFGLGSRFGLRPRLGFGPRFGLGSRFGLGPRLGFCPRILAISPGYGCRLPSSREAESPILSNLPIQRAKCHLYMGSV